MRPKWTCLCFLFYYLTEPNRTNPQAETLLEYLRRCGIKKAKYLQYLLDEEYRPNPKDYQPTEILYQLIVDNGSASA